MYVTAAREAEAEAAADEEAAGAVDTVARLPKVRLSCLLGVDTADSSSVPPVDGNGARETEAEARDVEATSAMATRPLIVDERSDAKRGKDNDEPLSATRFSALR